MNIELTTNCPLNCPYCYCPLTGNRNIDISKAAYWIEEGSKMGVKSVGLSGGEALLHPGIYEIVKTAAAYCESVNLSLSGYNFTEEVLNRLVEAGVTDIFISLNGSTEEINSLTRNGFGYALLALEMLKTKGFKQTWINWVMHSGNADDFQNMILLAEAYSVGRIVIMTIKPDSRYELSSVPDAEQMKNVARLIRNHKGNVQLLIETCFSPLLALASDNHLSGNSNTGIDNGCGAGLITFSVNVDGKLSPCRHLDYFEDCSTLEEYWNTSSVLKTIREAELKKRQPCLNCKLNPHCRHCLAFNSKLNGEIYFGNETCDLHT
jgi:pyrroloquinoline quinone biosynthesis protein E